MAISTIRIPLDFRNPRVSSLAGNAFFTVKALTSWDAGIVEFVKDVNGKYYGFVHVPSNLAATPNPAIILSIAANTTSGVTRLNCGYAAVTNTGSFNPGSLTSDTAQDVTVPGTLRQRKDVTFTGLPTLTVDNKLIVELFHNGTNGNDTLGENTELYDAVLRVDISS